MTSPGCPLSLPHTLQAEMLSTLPRLRAFALSLTGNVDRADDLVHDTLVQALTHIDQFEPGTCLRAWLFTILRNRFMTSCRRGRREQEDPNLRPASPSHQASTPPSTCQPSSVPWRGCPFASAKRFSSLQQA